MKERQVNGQNWTRMWQKRHWIGQNNKLERAEQVGFVIKRDVFSREGKKPLFTDAKRIKCDVMKLKSEARQILYLDFAVICLPWVRRILLIGLSHLEPSGIWEMKKKNERPGEKCAIVLANSECRSCYSAEQKKRNNKANELYVDAIYPF